MNRLKRGTLEVTKKRIATVAIRFRVAQIIYAKTVKTICIAKKFTTAELPETAPVLAIVIKC